jgi:prepilin-type N-terminal cleavage/methylation domain-containing protein/prepilin-type processing-associated H-X9-DG protein
MTFRKGQDNMKKAFTLIELLVVIAVIAVLMGILMPALSRAREMAKALKCQANLRTLTTAWYTYATDNDGKLNSSYNHTTQPVEGGNVRKEGSWAWAPWLVDGDAAAPYQPYAENQFTLEQRKEGIRRGALYPIVKDVAAYHCPSDRSKGGNYRSYSMPDSLNGKWGIWGKATWTNMKKMDEISNPSSAYVFVEENDPRGYNVSSWVLSATNPAAWGDPVTVWHDARSSFGFADGHAETWKWSIETLKAFEDYSTMGVKPSPKGDGIEDLRRIRSSWPHKKGERSPDTPL